MCASAASELPSGAVPSPPVREVLLGQKALVTGANSGIGMSVAIGLAQAGADVMVNFVTGEPAAQAVVREIRRLGRAAEAFQADVSKENEVEAMFRRIQELFGTLDILVPNAGIQRDAPITEMTLANWNEVLAVNLTGQFLCARAAIREFKRRGVRPQVSRSAGKIICMSSVHEVIPWAGHANYAASKGGVELLMKSIAQEVAPDHIRVNSVAPGAIRTPINRSVWDRPESYERLTKLVPLGRIGEPADIARAVVWLASDEAEYVTGTSLFVDGGMTLYPGFATGG